MIRGQRRFDLSGKILCAVNAFLVLGIIYAGSAFAAERPTGKKSPDRSLRATSDPRLLPIDDSPMRMRVETREGVLVVYDAPAPPELGEGCSGYMGYWLSALDKTQYVFGTTLYDQSDLSTILLALERDLGVDLEALADTDDRVDEALSALSEAPDEEIVWEPATLLRAGEVMGFDAKEELARLDEPGDGGVAIIIPCEPCTAGVGPPRNCGSPEGLAREAWAVIAGCCNDGGGGLPPNSGPCGGDLDCDGEPNGTDTDIDGDGLLNGNDPDVDGDGLPNGSDPDVDGDGIPNGSDPDVNNDGIHNGGDSDIDGDGLGNGSDADIDGDGLLNPDDPDDDGDGTSDGGDESPGGCTTDCPGACCTKSTGACASKKESECTATDKYFKGKEVSCSPNPCCPAGTGTNNPFDPQSANAYEVYPSWTWNQHFCSNGATEAERIDPVDVQISAVCDGSDWYATLVGLRGQYSQQSRLFPGQQEVTGPGGNSTSDNFCPQVTELAAFGFQYASCAGSPPYATWYMLEAVKQHELVHSDSLKAALKTIAPGVEVRIEALHVSHTPGKTKNDAIAEIRNVLPGFTTAVDRAFDDWVDQWALNPDQDLPGGLEEQAELAAVEWMVNWICGYSDAQCWTYCTACPQRPNGACCAGGETGLCSVKTRCDCQHDGGQYEYDGATCGPPNPCTGGCCLSETQCTEVTYTRCVSGLGGTYNGDGTTCSPNPCGPHP